MILCSGESLIDMIGEDGKGIMDSEYFKARIGGSPLNCAVGLSRLGVNTFFLTKVGNDYFGKKIKQFLISEKINPDYIFMDEQNKTTLAFISLSEKKIPEYDFYRNNTADKNITKKELEKINIDDIEMFHVGSLALIDGNTAKNLSEFFLQIEKKGKITSLDPNVRSNLIKNHDEYKRRLFEMMKKATILKLGEDDLKYFDPNISFKSFVKNFKREEKLTILTLGERGSIAFYKNKFFEVEALKLRKVVDTTGCGDAFMSGILYKYYEFGLKKDLSNENVYEMLNFASKIAGIVATRYGGASSMPMKSEVENF